MGTAKNQVSDEQIVEDFRVLLRQAADELDDQRDWWFAKALLSATCLARVTDPRRASYYTALQQLSPGALRVFEYNMLMGFQSVQAQNPTARLCNAPFIFDEYGPHYYGELDRLGVLRDSGATSFGRDFWAFLLPISEDVRVRARNHFLYVARQPPPTAHLDVGILGDGLSERDGVR